MTGYGGHYVNGSAASSSNYGIQNAGTIASAGTGSLTIIGYAGKGKSNNYGIYNNAGATITTASGTLDVEGYGGANGTTSTYTGNEGTVNDGSAISSICTSGCGAFTIVGTGAAAYSNNYGVYNRGGGTISTVAAALTITGTGGNGTNTGNYGTYLDATSIASSIASTGSGSITINSVGKNSAVDFVDSGANTVGGASDGGNINFNQDSATWDALAVRTSGIVTVAPITGNKTVGFSGGAGALGVTQAFMDDINAPTVVVGSLTDTGLLTTGAFNWEHTLTTLDLYAGGAAGSVTIGGAITKGIDNGSVANTSDGNLNVKSGSNIIDNAAISSSSTYGKLNLYLDSNYANASSGYSSSQKNCNLLELLFSWQFTGFSAL